MLYRAVSRTVVAGFVVENGRVVHAAPILRRWIIGSTVQAALSVLRVRGYEVDPVWERR